MFGHGFGMPQQQFNQAMGGRTYGGSPMGGMGAINPFGNQLGGVAQAQASVLNNQLSAPLGFMANRDNALASILGNRDTALGGIEQQRLQSQAQQHQANQQMQGQIGSAQMNAGANQYGSAANLLGNQYTADRGLESNLAGYGRDRDVTQMNQLQNVLRQARFLEVLPLLGNVLEGFHERFPKGGMNMPTSGYSMSTR